MGIFGMLLENAKAISTVVTACGAVGGSYIYFDGPIPASRQYVIAQTNDLTRRVIDGSLQTNTLTRSLVIKEKSDRQLELQKAQDPGYKAILEDRIQQIDKSLNEIDQEREALKEEKRTIGK